MGKQESIRGPISVTIVPVEDMARAADFYQTVLGLPLKFATPEWTEFETKPIVLALQLARAKFRRQQAEEARFTIDVEDIESETSRLKSWNVEFTVSPHEEEYGRMAVFHDTEGNGIELVERRRK